MHVMQLLKPDAIAIGNHEFDYGFARLDSLTRASGLPMLAANLVDDNGQGPFPRELHLRRQGLDILVLGLLPDDLHDLTSDAATAGVHVQDSREVARQWLAETEGRADLRIALSHRGWHADSILAATTPGFDVIVGGHSHTVIHPPVKVGRFLGAADRRTVVSPRRGYAGSRAWKWPGGLSWRALAFDR